MPNHASSISSNSSLLPRTGRGVITTEDVPAGTILLREAPFFAVNPDAAAAEGTGTLVYIFRGFMSKPNSLSLSLLSLSLSLSLPLLYSTLLKAC